VLGYSSSARPGVARVLKEPIYHMYRDAGEDKSIDEALSQMRRIRNRMKNGTKNRRK